MSRCKYAGWGGCGDGHPRVSSNPRLYPYSARKRRAQAPNISSFSSLIEALRSKSQGVYGDAYPRLHVHSLGLRADWVIDPTNDQTGAFWPGEPHRADVILEARADLRSDQPVACGGLRALQGPQPPALAVVANSPARCSSLISLMNSALVPLGRCPQQVRGSPTRCKMGAQRQCAACCQRVAAMAMANGPVGRHE